MTLQWTPWASSYATWEGWTVADVTRVFFSFSFFSKAEVSEPFGLRLHKDLCPFSLFAPWFLLTTRIMFELKDTLKMLWLSPFYSERTVSKGFRPLVTRGAEIRTQVLALSDACLSRMASNIDGWVPENLPCSWCFRVPRALSLALSCFTLSARSPFPGFCPRRPSAVQILLVAKACSVLDIECFSCYLSVHFYLNAFYIVCSTLLCHFWNYHWLPRDGIFSESASVPWSRW